MTISTFHFSLQIQHFSNSNKFYCVLKKFHDQILYVLSFAIHAVFMPQLFVKWLFRLSFLRANWMHTNWSHWVTPVHVYPISFAHFAIRRFLQPTIWKPAILLINWHTSWTLTRLIQDYTCTSSFWIAMRSYSNINSSQYLKDLKDYLNYLIHFQLLNSVQLLQLLGSKLLSLSRSLQ